MGRAADITDQVRIHNPWQFFSYAGSLVEACSFGALLRHPVSTFAFEPTIEYFCPREKRKGLVLNCPSETQNGNEQNGWSPLFVVMLCFSNCWFHLRFRRICVWRFVYYLYMYIYIHITFTLSSICSGVCVCDVLTMWYENTLFLMSLPSSLYLRYMTTCSLFPLPSHRWVSRFLRVCESAHFWLSKSL